MASPAFDNDLGFFQRIEDFTVEQFVTVGGPLFLHDVSAEACAPIVGDTADDRGTTTQRSRRAKVASVGAPLGLYFLIPVLVGN